MPSRRGRLAWLLIAFTLSPWASKAGDPPSSVRKDQNTDRASPAKTDSADAEADDELLEFLGSVDSEDRELIDYLSRTDAAALDKAKSAPAGSKAESSANGPTTGVTPKTVRKNE